MRVLVFNGTNSTKSNAANHIVDYFKATLQGMGVEVVVFNLAENSIPFFSEDSEGVPPSVLKMVELFRSCERHIWFSPLYHGGMTGAMKNCLDWLIVSAREKEPYLSHIKVALICWAYGGNASTGVDNMRVVANTLRAWTLPYSVPIVIQDLYAKDTKTLAVEYQDKFERMMTLLMS
ncbi:NADPH-dependent FMN reductase [[Muricauda] lutisoli]|uniref:NAD(P)H-dependent oxidoreductase n=1 Tax=[Muricauda] lutisoli TaxID=2816035 RepID=A0ABS3EVN3_9FLAO|nr:NAD(P)H-dependent oxidoreductase [[Muricauda] lutisoli]MBO0330305.1 NAD(P)H-dependent oxidoreductase [[Muricauda] lutisoli]